MANAQIVVAGNDAPVSRGAAYYAWHRFLANKGALFSGVLLLLILLVAIFAPFLTAAGPNEQKFLTTHWHFPQPNTGLALMIWVATISRGSYMALAFPFQSVWLPQLLV